MNLLMAQLPPLGVQPQEPKICDGRVQLYGDRQLFGVFPQEEKGWDNSKQQIDLLLQELTQRGQFLDSNTVLSKFLGKSRKRGVLQRGQEDEINRFTAYCYFCAWRAACSISSREDRRRALVRYRHIITEEV